MFGFDGVYVTADLHKTLAVIKAVLPEGKTATMTFRSSGYRTSAECHAKGSKITAELSADWANGYARRRLTAEQITDLMAELSQHGPTVWVRLDATSHNETPHVRSPEAKLREPNPDAFARNQSDQ